MLFSTPAIFMLGVANSLVLATPLSHNATDSVVSNSAVHLPLSSRPQPRNPLPTKQLSHPTITVPIKSWLTHLRVTVHSNLPTSHRFQRQVSTSRTTKPTIRRSPNFDHLPVPTAVKPTQLVSPGFHNPVLSPSHPLVQMPASASSSPLPGNHTHHGPYNLTVRQHNVPEMWLVPDNSTNIVSDNSTTPRKLGPFQTSSPRFTSNKGLMAVRQDLQIAANNFYKAAWALAPFMNKTERAGTLSNDTMFMQATILSLYNATEVVKFNVVQHLEEAKTLSNEIELDLLAGNMMHVIALANQVVLLFGRIKSKRPDLYETMSKTRMDWHILLELMETFVSMREFASVAATPDKFKPAEIDGLQAVAHNGADFFNGLRF